MSNRRKGQKVDDALLDSHLRSLPDDVCLLLHRFGFAVGVFGRLSGYGTDGESVGFSNR